MKKLVPKNYRSSDLCFTNTSKEAFPSTRHPSTYYLPVASSQGVSFESGDKGPRVFWHLCNLMLHNIHPPISLCQESMAANEFKPALIIVDLQEDFCPPVSLCDASPRP